jgi:hypothetical protein
MDIIELLFPPANPLQTYALVFLLGSLTVSSLSDLRRMAAQTDFAEVWGAYVAVMFLMDIYLGMTSQMPLASFVIKWAIIAAFAAATTGARVVTISTMDVTAIAALLSTLTPAYIILALALLVVANEIMKPALRGYGEGGAYPFLPTVLAVNLLILLIILGGGIEAYIGVKSLS